MSRTAPRLRSPSDSDNGPRARRRRSDMPKYMLVVTSDGTAPVITDGPFQEFKEWLAGYQIVDVENEARALEIAARLSAVPGPDGVPLEQPIQVRQVMEQAPKDA